MIIFPDATNGDGLGNPPDAAVIKQPYPFDTFTQLYYHYNFHYYINKHEVIPEAL